MKINYLFLISFFFCLPILAQFNQGTVTLIDGTQVTGLVKVSSSSIKFKKNSDSKSELQKKVKNKEFKKDDYAKVVTFYNENCGK